MTAKKKEMPWIVCVGEPARAVIFGWSAIEPKPEKPCKLYRAKMILEWTGKRGLLGLAHFGPEPGSRITCAIKHVAKTARQVLTVSDEAAKMIDEWPDA